MSNHGFEINTSKIIGIQFSILSPEEIRQSSVAEITCSASFFAPCGCKSPFSLTPPLTLNVVI